MKPYSARVCAMLALSTTLSACATKSVTSGSGAGGSSIAGGEGGTTGASTGGTIGTGGATSGGGTGGSGGSPATGGTTSTGGGSGKGGSPSLGGSIGSLGGAAAGNGGVQGGAGTGGGSSSSSGGSAGMVATGGTGGPVTYTNPIVTGNWSDPGVTKVGDYFYSTSSTFGWEPGLPIIRSSDLLHWDYVAYAYLDNSNIPTGTVSGGAWGVEIGYNPNNDTTICYVPINSKIYAYVANKPEGPYSGPNDTGISGIDPGFFADSDGRVYLITASSGGQIWELQSDGLKVKGTNTIATGLNSSGLFEGPEIIFRNGYYYVNYSPGGTCPTQNSAINAMRAQKLAGPWTENPNNPLMNANSSTNAALQGPSHGMPLQMPDGQWFLTYQAFEQNWVSRGRSMSMEPIEWTSDNWWRPKNGRIPSSTPQAAPNLPVSGVQMSRSDEFASTDLGLQWFFHTHPDFSGNSWSLSDRPGFMRIKTKGGDVGSSDSLSNVFLQRITLKVFDVTTKVDFDASSGGEAAGILLYKKPTAHIELSTSVCGTSKCFTVTKDGTRTQPFATATNTIGNIVYLKISVDGKENATFFYGADGVTWTALGGSINFGKNGSPYIGWKCQEWSAGTVGFFAVKNSGASSKNADFDWFHHEAP